MWCAVCASASWVLCDGGRISRRCASTWTHCQSRDLAELHPRVKGGPKLDQSGGVGRGAVGPAMGVIVVRTGDAWVEATLGTRPGNVLPSPPEPPPPPIPPRQ